MLKSKLKKHFESADGYFDKILKEGTMITLLQQQKKIVGCPYQQAQSQSNRLLLDWPKMIDTSIRSPKLELFNDT